MVLVTEDGLRSRLLFLPSGSLSMQSGGPSCLADCIFYIFIYRDWKKQQKSLRASISGNDLVLIITSLRKKREQQPPNSLGLAYFREDR